MRLWGGLAIAGAVWQIVAVSLGARVTRWESVVWAAIVIGWVVIAMLFEGMSRDRG